MIQQIVICLPGYKTWNDQFKFQFLWNNIQRCKEDSLRVLAGYGACKTNDTIDNLINPITISFEFLDYYPDVLNYEKPFKKYIYAVSNMLYKNTFTARQIMVLYSIIPEINMLIYILIIIKYLWMNLIM